MRLRLLRLGVSLVDRWQWLRHTWWFQPAHSPLCARYHQDVLRLGRLRLCRSCTLLYLALVSTAALLLAWPAASHLLPVAAALLLPPTLLLSYPPLYHRLSRHLRDVVRFASGAALGLLVAVLLGQPLPVVAGAILTLVGLHRAFRARRQAIKRQACTGCPELGQNAVCSGYACQAESIRAYRTAMETILNQPLMLPLVAPPAQRRR